MLFIRAGYVEIQKFSKFNKSLEYEYFSKFNL